jgi:hypothetical protein
MVMRIKAARTGANQRRGERQSWAETALRPEAAMRYRKGALNNRSRLPL